MEIKVPDFYSEKSAKVTKIAVRPGDTVKAWGEICTIETGKGSQVLKSKKAGVVKSVSCEVGKDYACGTVLAVVEEADARPAEKPAAPVEKPAEKAAASAGLFEVKMPDFYEDKSARVTKVAVKQGDSVKAWGEICTIETSKGSQVLKSKKAGVVKVLNCEAGKDYPNGTVLAQIAVGETAAQPVTAEKPAESTAAAEIYAVKMPEFYEDKSAKVTKVAVKQGDSVKAWGEICTIETSKGSQVLKSKKAGVVKTLHCEAGKDYPNGTVLAEIAVGSAAAQPAAEAPSAGTVKENSAEADLLILGGGTGGYMAAIAAARKGRKVTIVEKNRLGGTCLNVGCIPTKALIASALTYQKVLQAETFGVKLHGTAEADMGAMIERKDKIVDTLVNGVGYLMRKNQITVVKGSASFLDDTHVLVSGGQEKTTYTFKDCIIATGSVVSNPPVQGLDNELVLDSTKALADKELPKSIVIVGGGVIGMEFAFLYRNLGAEVTVIEFLPRLLAVLDPDLSEKIEEIARERGIQVETGAGVKAIQTTVDGKALTSFEKEGKLQYAVSDKVLVATGRKPNLEGLGLEKTGIALNERGRGIKVDDHMKTSVDHIYAVGDVNNRIQLAHAASEEGIIAVENMTGGERTFDVTMVPSVIFTEPEIATVGLNRTQCQEKGIAFREGVFHYRANGKALTMNETEGFVRLLKDEHDVIIGGAVIGADASNLIAVIAEAVANHLKDTDLDRTIFAHPTTAEVVHEAALDLSIGAFNE